MITLLIPTINRSDFLIRQLHYYRDVGFQGHICIGDSSEVWHVNRIKKAIEELRGSINIKYREYPGVKDPECIKRLLELVETPYAAFVADDDFLIPSAMEQCIRFLETHAEYSAAHGAGITINLKSSGAFGHVNRVRKYPQPVVEGESAELRITEHLSNYLVTLFSVHRKETWQKMYKNISFIADRTFTGEMLPCCSSVIQGKVKELDCFYLVRQDHSQRYILPGPNNWISSQDWPAWYQTFRETLAGEISENDGISMSRALKVIEHAFGVYMDKLSGKDWRSRCGRPEKGPALHHLRQIASKIPGTYFFWHMLHKSDKKTQVEIPLAEFMSESSPYYADFAEVNRILTTGFPGK